MSAVIIGIVVLMLFAVIGAGIYLAVKQGLINLPGTTPTPTSTGGTGTGVDCDYTSGPWDPELCPCGGGVRTRTNTIITEASGDGSPCPPIEETRSCTAPTCAPGVNRPCQFTTDGWQPAVCPCEGGEQIKTNTIISEAVGTGATCPPAIQQRQCTGGVGCDAQDCVFEYGTWEPAECPCGGPHTQTRTNNIITPASGGGTCVLPVEERTCTGAPCPINCAYTSTAWTPSACACGQNCVQSRTHTITTHPDHGGTECPAAVKAGVEYNNISGPECLGSCTYDINVYRGWTTLSLDNMTESQCIGACDDAYIPTRNCQWTKT